MWWWSKRKMNSSPEELENLCSPPKNVVSKRGFWDSSCRVQTAAIIAFLILLGLYIVIPNLFMKKNFTTYKPEIRLDSLIFCPTDTSKDNLVIWDLRFDITNPNNGSIVCIYPFEVSIFFYNQTKLLKKAPFTQRCFGPRNHTSASVLADAFLVNTDDLDRIWNNGTISFDLKIHGVFLFKYSFFEGLHRGELVCGDAKVALSTSSNLGYGSLVGGPSSNSGYGSLVGGPVVCGSLVGVPVVCSYEYYH